MSDEPDGSISEKKTPGEGQSELIQKIKEDEEGYQLER